MLRGRYAKSNEDHVTNFSKDNTAQTGSIDAIELAVIRSALANAAEEMSVTVWRTSRRRWSGIA